MLSPSSPVPSTFATLLRRSKFASYDPIIGQVYTASGGHAHRGDWGVKRPLPNRHRDAGIRLRNVDTIYQHTDWKNAWKDTSFMKNFQELDVEPENGFHSRWQSMRSGPCEDLWTEDTDFDSRGSASRRESEQALFWEKITRVPDVRAMSSREFGRFVRRVRKLRPEFLEFCKEKKVEKRQQGYQLDPSQWSASSNTEVDVLSIENAHVHFLSDQSKRTALEVPSKAILQLPHRNAGLSYAQPSQLHSYIFALPHPGRVLASAPSAGPERVDHWPAVGGFKGQPVQQSVLHKKSYDESSRSNHGKPEIIAGTFRAKEATLTHVPITVGRYAQSTGPARLKVRFEDWKAVESEHRIPHMPGSRAYNGSADLRGRRAQESRTMLSYYPPSSLKSQTKKQVEAKENELIKSDLIKQLRVTVSKGASGSFALSEFDEFANHID